MAVSEMSPTKVEFDKYCRRKRELARCVSTSFGAPDYVRVTVHRPVEQRSRLPSASIPVSSWFRRTSNRSASDSFIIMQLVRSPG